MALREAEGVTENVPMVNLPLVVQPLQTEVVSVAEAAGASLDPITGVGVEETPENNDSHRDPQVGGRLMQFSSLKHYYEWLRTSISPQAETNQASTDHIRIQKSAKRPGSSLLYPLSPEETCDRKSMKHRVSWVLQSPVSSPKATTEMETSHRLKQAKSIRKVQNGDPRINKNILKYRGMGDINRPTGRLSPYSNSPKIAKVPGLKSISSPLFHSG